MRAGNKIKIESGMSSMTDLVFLLLIFFIIISTLVNTSHEIKLPEGTGDPSLTSPVKVYIDAENNFYLNSDPKPIQIGSIDNLLTKTQCDILIDDTFNAFTTINPTLDHQDKKK